MHNNTNIIKHGKEDPAWIEDLTSITTYAATGVVVFSKGEAIYNALEGSIPIMDAL